MRRSFAVRLAAAFAGVGIAAAALTAILVNLAFGERLTNYLQEQRHVREQQLVAALADSYARMGEWNTADLDGLAALALMDGGEVRLEDQSRTVIWEPVATEAGAQMAGMHRQMMGGGPVGPERRLAVSVEGRVVGTAVVRIPEPGGLPQDRAFRGSVNRLLFVGGIVAGVLALGLGVLLARRATAPARELTKAARDLAAGDRSRRVAFETDDELGEMGRAFNAMADTIEEEDRLRRTFAADVAHELRTPLAILHAQVEGIQDGVVTPDAPALASLHEETLRVSRLVADLETLASAEAAGFSLEPRPTRLDVLVAEAAREFAGSFAAQEVTLETTLVPAQVVVDATRMRQVTSNLLSNAVKFTPPGGNVRLEVCTEGGEALVRVSDSGPGIPADELPHVFERFYRGRDARARGSGIGLTVARELVRAHGGEIGAESEPGRGTVFTVRLPIASSASRTTFTDPSSGPATVGSKGGSG